MSPLQAKALNAVLSDLDIAENLLLSESGTPAFGAPSQRGTPANEVWERIRSARAWVSAVANND